jgi:predicted PurR-regulated permease PerM
MYRRPPTSHRGATTGRLQRRSIPQATPVSLQAKMFWGVSFVLVLIALFWLVWPVFSMLVGSSALAYLLDPVVDRLERRGMSRSSAIGLLFLTGFIALAVVALVIVPSVAQQFAVLSHNIADYLSRVDALVAPWATWIEAKTGIHVPIDPLEIKATLPELIKKISPDARASIQGYLTGAFSSGLGLVLKVFNLALLPIFTFFLLRDWDRLIAAVDELVPPRYREPVRRIAREVDLRLGGFVQGQITVALVLAVLYSIGLRLVGIDLAYLVGITAGLLFVVPYLGTVIGIVVSVALAILKFGFDGHLLGVAAAFAIPQAFESWFLTPRIMGDKVGLHPMVVMVALIVGGNLLGVWGMLVAIPITATLSVILSEWIRRYRASRVFGDTPAA